MSIVVLLSLVAAGGFSLLFCWLARLLFPRFRSGERKQGFFRADQSTGSLRLDFGSASRRVEQPAGGRDVQTLELPLVGGPAMTLAAIVASVITGWMLQLPSDQWLLLLILLAGLTGFTLVGFLDDFQKWRRGSGISEIQKFAGVLIVSLLISIALNRLVPSAKTAYSPYSEIPLLGTLLKHVRFIWPAFFLLLTSAVSSTTALSVDFADGLDGLAGGLMVSAALGFAAIILVQHDPGTIPLVLAALVLAGSSLGFLPHNWPSAWAARGRSRTARRAARLYMGDSGALGLGGLLGLIAIVSRQELPLIFIGGAFVLEGYSALAQRVYAKAFRRFLRVIRFSRAKDPIPHTEFPLPFMATPMHHHFDLLGWDRRRLVYGAWTLGAGFATLSVAAALAPFTWQRYLARFLALLIAIIIWRSGRWTRSYFIGLHPFNSIGRRQLALFYGFPFRLFGRAMYHLVETVPELGEDAIQNPIEESLLWQRISIYDARTSLGYFCYRAGYYNAAINLWKRIPSTNLKARPDIREFLRNADQLMLLERETTQPMRIDELTIQILPPNDERHQPSPNGGKAGGKAASALSEEPGNSPPASEEPGSTTSNAEKGTEPGSTAIQQEPGTPSTN
jgi:UDP-N-acetylmuramyl pentapeptide phosphotransferase/UDP-N-acetylglucosamine-1-phosphate transferase